MNQEDRIKLLKWLDKVTPDQLKEFDLRFKELQQ